MNFGDFLCLMFIFTECVTVHYTLCIGAQFWFIVKCLTFEVECVCASGMEDILLIGKFN